LKPKHIIIAGTVAVLAVSYPASSWYFGKRTEEIVQQKITSIKAIPGIKLVQNDYERGLFRSQQTIVVELPQKSAPPLRLTFKTDVRHGPLFEAGKFRSASATTVLEPDASQKELRQAFGDKPPVMAQMLLDFCGGGHSTITVPEFRFVLPEKGTLSGDGLQLSGEFEKDYQGVSAQGTAPRFELSLENGTRLTLAGLEFSGKQRLVFPDEPLFYAGTQKVSFSSLEFVSENKPKITLNKINMEMDTPVSGEFIDVIARLAAQDLRVGEQNFGPVAYDYSAKHLRARALMDLNREIMSLSEKTTKDSAIRDKFVALLFEDGTRVAIDRLSFHLPEGELRFSANLGIVGAQAEDLDNPFLLAGKFDAHAELSLPAAVKTLAQMLMPPMKNESEMESMIAQLTHLGYVTNDAGTLKTSLTFKAGKLTVNGKPFNFYDTLSKLKKQRQKTMKAEEDEQTPEQEQEQEAREAEPSQGQPLPEN
jgi:uncharacterized protein YdgA (DUF945 family)